ncbi:MAB_1171c family putative transporter [Kitasatospora sp. NPDC058965]|uniref:MAB_1171c family putative transporter n=1 Tax=Kitasatospora sp. NPDC058965 TaxID=3346682 RepID=UPI0036C7DE0F
MTGAGHPLDQLPPHPSPVKLAILALLWLVTLWRLPSALRDPRRRTLWTAFAGATGLVTLGLPICTRVVDGGTGVHNLVILVKHLIGLVSCHASLSFVAETARPELARRLRRPQWGLLAAAAAGLVVSFCLLRQPSEVADFYQGYPGSVPAAVYAAIVTGYLGSAMGLGCWLFTTNARRAARRSLRAGLVVLALGTASGFLYTVLRVWQILDQLAERPMFLSEDVLYAFEWAAIALVLLGSLLPAGGVALRALRDWRTARRLAPLWTALTEAVPEVVLTARLGRAPRVRLHRLVIEIRDAALVLAGYADAPLPADADSEAEARWLRAAAARRRGGLAPGHRGAATGDTAIDEVDFDAETARLLRLAGAYARG